MIEKFKCRLVTWDEVHDWTNSLVDKLKHERIKPDAVVGITRGGWAPARLVCDELIIKNLYSLKTEHWGITAVADGTAKIAHPLNADVKGKNVLVVDDITDTGQSMKLAIDHIKEYKPKSVVSATLLHITRSALTPDFYGAEVPEKDWTWFVFPWNFNEDLQTLIPKALDPPKNASKIRNALFSQFQIDVDEEKIQKALVALSERGLVKEMDGLWEAPPAKKEGKKKK